MKEINFFLGWSIVSEIQMLHLRSLIESSSGNGNGTLHCIFISREHSHYPIKERNHCVSIYHIAPFIDRFIQEESPYYFPNSLCLALINIRAQ